LVAKQLLHQGVTSKSIPLFVVDTTSPSGAGLTGLVFNSSGLTAYYWREGSATATAINLLSGTPGSWLSGGFSEVDTLNLPGVYQLDLPDAALAAGATWVAGVLKGATNMAPVPFELRLSGADMDNATSLGLTDLDAAISSRLATASISLAAGAVTVGTNNDKSAYSLAANAVDASQFTQAAADKVWTSASRTLTAFSQSFSDQVWSSVARTLTAFGFSVTVGTNSDKTGYSLSANAVDAAQFTQAAADKVWTSATRSLTAAVDILQSAADKVWASVARSLTAFGFNVTVGANLDKTGYDLTAGSIAAIDTELSGVHGAGAWGTGTGIGANLVTLTVQSSGAVPIASVPVTVKNSGQTATVAVGTTDVNGQVAFNLDNGTYKVLVVSSPSYTTLPVQTLVVSGTTTATYTLSAFNPGTPTSPSLCRIFGTLRKLDGSVAVNSKVSFSLISSLPVESNDTLIVVRQIEALTDTAGYFFVDLTRSSTLLQVGTTIVPTYLVSSGEAHLHHSFTVPDAGSADLLSLTLTSA
jgi:hypothetical protein